MFYIKFSTDPTFNVYVAVCSVDINTNCLQLSVCRSILLLSPEEGAGDLEEVRKGVREREGGWKEGRRER